ncbi:MAG: HDOD domain-containing protein [Candidatus Omnitrophica bacterium]|nr:HDOD domain-containing protein [Candidatus Omnitrophota bacterium]
MSPSRNIMFTALDSMEDLPTMPSVIQQIQSVLSDDDASADKIAQIISEDPSLTSKILKVVNSAFYAARGSRISSVKLAVARLGLSEVNRICQLLSVIKTFSDFGLNIDHVLFWKHSLMCGMTARYLHQLAQLDSSQEDDVYVGGLLHDIGFLILDQYFPAPLREIGDAASGQGLSFAEAEQQIIQSDHGEIGSFVLEKWNLSPGVILAVSFHHKIDQCDPHYKNIALLVQAADAICAKEGVGGVFEHDSEYDSDAILEQIGLTSKWPEIETFVEKLRKESDSLLAV